MARTAPVPNIPPIPGMCPSIAVLGGGGDGGGGGGNGAGNGNGNGPGDGSGDGDAAGGAGNGSGTCGTGAGGSCANCTSGTAAGDPVDVHTGEVFTHAKTDLFLKGPFNLAIDRTYSSFATGRDVGLGWGWTHSLAWHGEVRRDKITIWNGLGQTIEFPRLKYAGDSSSLAGWSLLRTTNTYVLRAGDEFFHTFAPNPESTHELQLRTIKYRNLGEIRLDYRGAKLATVTDAAGRVVHLMREPGGRIAALQVPNATGESLVFARYEYDDAGNLIEAVDADGHRFEYRYDDHHRLVAMVVPGGGGSPGVVFHYAYDDKGRCIETWGARPDGLVDPSLDPSLPELLADGVTRAKGIYHARIDFVAEGYVEVADSVRVQRFFAGEDGKTAKAINGRGGITSRKMDPDGNITAHTDANASTWTYVYDHLGNVAVSIDPEDRTIKFSRDREGRIVRAEDGSGRVFEYGRDGNGHVEWVRGPRGGITVQRYDRRGLRVERVDPNGARTRYEYDSHGNVVKVTYPNGAVATQSYDFWGRITAETLADGRAFTYRHTPSGRLVEVRDSIGRTRQISYDALGNIVNEREPNGTDWSHRMSGLGWLAASTDPMGTEVRAFYNREGWLLRLVNERGETT